MGKSDWADAARIGGHVVSQSVFHLGEALAQAPQHEDVVVSIDEVERSAALSPLEVLLSAALPATTEERRGQIARELLREGLTVAAMQGALQLGGGAAVLFNALNLESAGESQLRRGERLALVTSLRTPLQPFR